MSKPIPPNTLLSNEPTPPNEPTKSSNHRVEISSSTLETIDDPLPSGHSNLYTMLFTIALCTLCALVLGTMASGLKVYQQRAIELERHKQMLMAAHLINHQGQLLIRATSGASLEQWQYAVIDPKGHLINTPLPHLASNQELNLLYQSRIKPMFTDSLGLLKTPEELSIEPESFFVQHEKTGFSQLEHKLIYALLADESVDAATTDPKKGAFSGYLIPVNGQGLWGPIYGYLAIEADAETVLGISWYNQSETPGLGANIVTAIWQSQFQNKKIFQADSKGTINPHQSPLGIVVVKGRVKEVLGDDPRSQNSVDGMSGATITGNGVTKAYKDVLEQYRPLLERIIRENKANTTPGAKAL